MQTQAVLRRPGDIVQIARRLCQELHQIRLQLGLSQADVARAMDMPTSQSSISDYETGVSSPTLRSLVRWADALGCTLRIEPGTEQWDERDLRGADLPHFTWREWAVAGVPDRVFHSAEHAQKVASFQGFGEREIKVRVVKEWLDGEVLHGPWEKVGNDE